MSNKPQEYPEKSVDSVDSYENAVFSALSALQEPPAGLLPGIMAAIDRKRRFHARIKFFGFLAVLSMSLPALVLAFRDLGQKINALGTFEIFSLLFSDWAVVAANWQEFVFSFLETLPVSSIAFLSLGFLAALISVRFVLNNLPSINLNLTSKSNSKI